MTNAIELKDVSIQYADHIAIHSANLEVRCCRVTAFVGPSGSGKTSLLKSFNRMTDLEDDCVVSGSIGVRNFGEVVDCPVDVVALRRNVGLIFQKPNPFPISIRKNFELPLRERGVKRREQLHGIMEKSLKRVGLWDEVSGRLDERADKLSGGQQQRLCIARAIALEPDILLLDEPCSALDPMSTEIIEELVSELKSSFTVIVVTHNLAQARRIADDLVVFWADETGGTLVETGMAHDIFDAPQTEHARCYIQGLKG